MKAVCTILGWCTAAAAAAGADVADGTAEGAGIVLFEAPAEPCSPQAAFLRSFVSLVSPSELLPMLCGAEELVGVVISIGSPATGDGADVFIIGVGVGGVVMMGIVRVLNPSSGSRPGRLRGTCSVAAAIGSHSFYILSTWGLGGGGERPVKVLLYQFKLQGARSSGWAAPRSRSTRALLVPVPVSASVPFPVPGDAAGCRRQDMGDPSNNGIGDGSNSKSASRDDGGSVAAEAGEKERPSFVIRKRSARWQRRVVYFWDEAMHTQCYAR